MRAALPEHPVHRRLLPLPHPHGRRRQGGARARRRQRRPPAGLAVLERAHRPAHARAGARRDAGQPGAGPRLGRGLDIPIGGETILFVDCEAAFYRTSVPRAVAQMLQMAGYEFGLMGEQWCCGGPAAEMGYVDQAKRFARHNLDNWRADRHEAGAGARPARLHQLHRGLPEVLRRGVRHRGRARRRGARRAAPRRAGRPAVPVDRAITYHDPCRLNKRKGIWEEPRELLRAIPGLRFEDVDRVTQWSYCSGGGGGLPIEKPELTAKISACAWSGAAELDVDTLVSACPWSERPLSEAGDAAGHRRRRPARAARGVARHHRRRLPRATSATAAGPGALRRPRPGPPDARELRRRWRRLRATSAGCGCGGH